ncbi:hypothetical protein MDOR_24670 [Mycolicibacterium doricum]|uniref:Uncharacterized protein n=1 Tax=Mycolicibacterium doricum TaxID=126673 RepID=A0A7I7VXN9_9MYCO|nr:hypothetical protein MDOR_24670 [Mycolicibacterium doricum]
MKSTAQITPKTLTDLGLSRVVQAIGWTTRRILDNRRSAGVGVVWTTLDNVRPSNPSNTVQRPSKSLTDLRLSKCPELFKSPFPNVQGSGIPLGCQLDKGRTLDGVGERIDGTAQPNDAGPGGGGGTLGGARLWCGRWHDRAAAVMSAGHLSTVSNRSVQSCNVKQRNSFRHIMRTFCVQ